MTIRSYFICDHLTLSAVSFSLFWFYRDYFGFLVTDSVVRANTSPSLPPAHTALVMRNVSRVLWPLRLGLRRAEQHIFCFYVLVEETQKPLAF